MLLPRRCCWNRGVIEGRASTRVSCERTSILARARQLHAVVRHRVIRDDETILPTHKAVLDPDDPATYPSRPSRLQRLRHYNPKPIPSQRDGRSSSAVDSRSSSQAHCGPKYSCAFAYKDSNLNPNSVNPRPERSQCIISSCGFLGSLPVPKQVHLRPLPHNKLGRLDRIP